MSCSSCCISSASSLQPIFLIALAQSAMAAFFFGMGDGGFCDYLLDKLGGVREPLIVGCLDLA